MKNKKSLAALAVLSVVLFAVAGFAYGKLADKAGGQSNLVPSAQATAKPSEKENGTEQKDEVPRFKATDFTVYDADGNSVNLSDFEGKPVVVNFWASWCGPCQMEMPSFEQKYNEYSEEIHFLMVNMTDGGRETVETAKEFMENTEYTFPVYFDTDMDASKTYRVYSLPTTLFIDAEGYGIAQANGALNAEVLQQGIDMIYTSAEQNKANKKPIGFP